MRNLSRKGTIISKNIGKAIADYNLIEDGDRILVAVSGGKDSFVLLHLLNERRRWAPIRYEILAAHIENNYFCSSCLNRKRLEKIFKKIGCKYRFKKIKLSDGENKGISCFWCAWNRRKALFELADKLGCNKVAMGHHKDDIIETLLLNLFFNGSISTMNVRQSLFSGKVIIIRPLAYTEERQIEEFASELGFKKNPCCCPNSYISKRRMVREIIKKVSRVTPHAKTNLFKSTTRVKEDYLAKPIGSEL